VLLLCRLLPITEIMCAICLDVILLMQVVFRFGVMDVKPLSVYL